MAPKMTKKGRLLLLQTDEVLDGPGESAEPEAAQDAVALILEAGVEAPGESAVVAHVMRHRHVEETASRRVVAPEMIHAQLSLTSLKQKCGFFCVVL